MQSTPKQRTLWLLAAIAAPTAHFSGCGWLTAGLTALAVLPLSLFPKSWEGLPKPIALLEILWLGVVAGYLLSGSGVYWPSDNDLAVPLTILALAACTNAAAAPRIGAVLAFCMGLLAIPQAVSGAAHLKIQWLQPVAVPWTSGLAVSLLLPSVPAAGEGRKWGILSTGALVVALAALIQGVIAPECASGLPDAFYQMARTLGHLEPVAAAAMTLGWYAVTALLLQSAKEIAQTCGWGGVATSVLVTGISAGAILFLRQADGWIMSLLSAVMWVVIPFLNKINNSEKSKK